MNSNNPFQANQQFINHDDEGDMEGVELAPSETSQDLVAYPPPQKHQFKPTQRISNNQMVFPPRQMQQLQQSSRGGSQQHQNYLQKDQQNMSQSLLNLSDSVALQESHPPHSNNQPSSLVKQLFEKVRNQAERLQRLENYKQLCEKRIVDLEPKHPLPVMPNHIGVKSLQQAEPHSVVELKRLLAIREQDLTYAKQRNEKMSQELDTLRKQAKEQESSDQNEALRKEIQLNESLQRQLEFLNQGNVLEKIRQLEEEKNALLDYIEDNVEKSQHQNLSDRSAHDKSVESDRLRLLESEKNKLHHLSENLKYQDALKQQRINELEQQLQSNQPDNSQQQQQIKQLRTELQDIHSRYNQRCEEYAALVKQIDPHFQENTFGNIDDIHQKLVGMGTLQKELDFSKEQFESTKTNLTLEKEQLVKKIEQMEDNTAQLEERLILTENERQNLWERLQRLEGEGQQVDELMHENDNLQREMEKLNSRIKILKENSSTLSQTLNETQQELESLVNDHEKLSEDYQRAKGKLAKLEDEREHYLNINNQNEGELGQLRAEVVQLRTDQSRTRDEGVQKKAEVANLNDSLYRAENENRDLRQKVRDLEKEIHQIQTVERGRLDKQTNDWEMTFEGLTKELQNVQGELTTKEQVFLKVEQELRNKLSQMSEIQNEKSSLRRRIDDLQSEVTHLQTTKFDKEEKLKTQILKNEELLEELEKLNEGISHLKEEREMTLQLRSEWDKEMETTQRQVSKYLKIADRVAKQVMTGQKLTREFNAEFMVKALSKDLLPSVTSSQDEQGLEHLLMECDQVLYVIVDWINQVTQLHRGTSKQVVELKSELQLAQQRVIQLEQKCKTTTQDEFDSREKERYLTTELDTLREKLRMRDEEKKDIYYREEKIQRQNQQIKQQLEGCRKEQEKLLMQIKSLLAEKERLIEENKQRVDMAENDLDRVKTLEVKLQQIYLQKETVMSLIERLKDAMPAENLQRIFSEIIETIHDGFKAEEEQQECENSLLIMEGEVRQYAKKEVSGLLSTKVINLRKDVEKHRQILRDIQNEKELIERRRDSLEQELKCTEMSERRRNDVALETEKSLTEFKFENSNLKREIQYLSNNRQDLEVALASTQEEKRMIERELLSIRAQLQMKATGRQTSISAMTGQPPLPPQPTGASLRNGNRVLMNSEEQASAQRLNTYGVTPFQGYSQSARDRFSSAEKNQRIMLTEGMNTSRADDTENIEPNRSLDYQQPQKLNYYQSFTSFDQPLQQNNQSSIGKPPTRNLLNNFKRPLTNRSSSLHKLGAPSFDEPYEELDEKEYPIRTSLQKRLGQVKNVFSAIRKNLQDQQETSNNDEFL